MYVLSMAPFSCFLWLLGIGPSPDQLEVLVAGNNLGAIMAKAENLVARGT